ncbi:MAG: hypothetical protein A2724_07780 [Fluviicola sp. RIFCSPHIGHO2_01_FULL_43_53]|nr:MAG: hypothetical protein A2724_07780 [Fluviicola sp. RIFCSPHIGHO2_01_FULL_43_53]
MIFPFFGLFFILVIGLAAGTVILIVWLVNNHSRSNQTYNTPVSTAPNERFRMMDAVRNKRHLLTSWSNYNSADLRSWGSYSYSRSMGGNSVAGKLYAKDGNPVIIFKRSERGFHPVGEIAVCSTAFEYFFVYSTSKISIYYKREPLGELLSNGKILSPEGKEIGSCKHPVNSGLTTTNFVDFNTGDKRYTLDLYGRTLATFYVCPRLANMREGGSRLNQQNDTRIFDLHYAATVEEEKWLIALALLGIVLHGYWFSE